MAEGEKEERFCPYVVITCQKKPNPNKVTEEQKKGKTQTLKSLIENFAKRVQLSGMICRGGHTWAQECRREREGFCRGRAGKRIGFGGAFSRSPRERTTGVLFHGAMRWRSLRGVRDARTLGGDRASK